MDMEARRKEFQTFLALHAHKAVPTETPVAHLLWHSPNMALDAPLVQLTREDVLEALDPENSELVRWLLEQLRTYDCTRQRIVGLVFDERTVLSEVLRMPAQ